MKKIDQFRRKFSRMQNPRFAFFLLFLILIGSSVRAEDEHAYIFIDPRLGEPKIWANYDRIRANQLNLQDKGYKVHLVKGTTDLILEAILRPNTRAITFFGEGGFGSGRDEGASEPTLATATWQTWRMMMEDALRLKYLDQGMSFEKARTRAYAESFNFGLDIVYNFSCYSLVNTRIGDLFVKPGGVYYGTPHRYNPIEFMGMYPNSDTYLTEYRRPEEDPDIFGNDEVEIVNNRVKPIQPSWGPGLPDKEHDAYIVYPPYPGASNCYKDGGKIWIWTGKWYKYLVENGDGFLEYEASDQNNAKVRYERQRDNEGRLVVVTLEDGKKQWQGPTTNLSTDAKGWYYIVWQ